MMKLNIEKIRVLRIEKGYSQEYAADKLNISQAKYSRIENGTAEVTLSTFGKLVSLLGTPPENVVIFTSEVKKNNDRSLN